MIYKKDANFPYPILTNTSNSYENCSFTLEVNLEENTNDYIFEIDYDISSEFITKLLERGQAELILVIKSKDNKFFNLEFGEKVKYISKTRISLSKRTTIQLFIQSKEEISFSDNHDLSSFYNEFKDEIVVPKNSILGFSNCPMFDGSISRPLELFEKKVDPNLKSDVKIEIGSETIIINYKNEELQFANMSQSSAFNNPYVYMGLQKALYKFIVNNDKDHEEVNIEEMEPPTSELEFKLYNLMKKKKVSELNIDNIDEVIYAISDKILEKYSVAVRRLYSDGN